MTQRPLSLHLHLMSSAMCMLPTIFWPENHLDCVGDDDEHDCDEALDQLDDPAEGKGEVGFFGAGGAVAEEAVGFGFWLCL